MGIAKFIQEGQHIDYTPGSAVVAGDVVVLGELVGVAAVDIAANKLGALQVEGLFDFPKATGGGAAIADGVNVFWDATAKEAETDSALGVNKFLGKVIGATVDADTTVRVKLAGAGALSVAHGQHTTIDADDTVVTGLSKVLAVVATLDDDPVDGAMAVTSTVGDQAGAPAAGSIDIKTWKWTDADATHIAATTFTKLVNWIAIGI